MTKLENLGRIQQIALQGDWTLVSETFAAGTRRTYCLGSDEEVLVNFYRRAKNVSNLSASHFHRLICASPQVLDSQELQNLEVILRDASEPDYFELYEAHTEELNGVRILMLEGFWKIAAVETLACFIDAAGDGAVVEEIHFTAPSDKFRQLQPVIREALKTVMWKTA